MIQNRLRLLRDRLQRAADEGEIAGANALVLHHGREELYCEAGFARLEPREPMRRDTIFRLYSMTKPITAAAAMILLERGEIDLMDPVSRYLEGFRGQTTTLQHLLSMTSGLVYGDHDSDAGRHTAAVFDEIGSLSTREMADRLGRFAPAFEPGSGWCYGASADVLGAVVEAASGMRFGAFLQQEIFEPLGMRDTGFWVPPEKRGRLACAYSAGPEGLRLFEEDHLGVQNRMERAPAFESGGAGLVSTIDDYARFAQMLLHGGSWNGAEILAPATVRFFTGAHLTERQQRDMDEWNGLSGFSYGNLMRVLRCPGLAQTLGCAGEYGWDGWMGCYFCNVPSRQMTFLLMAQRPGAGTFSLTRRMRNIVFSALDE